MGGLTPCHFVLTNIFCHMGSSLRVGIWTILLMAFCICTCTYFLLYPCTHLHTLILTFFSSYCKCVPVFLYNSSLLLLCYFCILYPVVFAYRGAPVLLYFFASILLNLSTFTYALCNLYYLCSCMSP